MNKNTVGSGLDDFTAIDGVGPVTAQKLHEAGLYTYDDLRENFDKVNLLVGFVTHKQIRDWLDRHLL